MLASRRRQVRAVPLLQAEDEHQSLVHGAQLACTQPSGRPSESLRSTTAVCSTRTRVSVPPRLIAGRKLAGRACVEVGATSTVLRSRNSSAWTTTA